MKVKERYSFEPDYAVAPGNTLWEVCEYKHITQRELAVRLDCSVQTINRIIKGSQPISYDIAAKLELVTGMPANFWNNLEANYRSFLKKKNN